MSIRLTIDGDGSATLVSKRIAGWFGEPPRLLHAAAPRQLGREDVSRFLALIEESRFWSMPAQDDNHIWPAFDATTYWLEGVRDGTYHGVERRDPEPVPFYEAGRFLLHLARVERCGGHGAMSQHKLSDLKYVGYVKTADGGDLYAIVEAPDGLTQRMRRGEYMGFDHGQIMEITEQYIELKEIVHMCEEGKAKWVERPNHLAIQGAMDPVQMRQHQDRVPYRGAQTKCP